MDLCPQQPALNFPFLPVLEFSIVTECFLNYVSLTRFSDPLKPIYKKIGLWPLSSGSLQALLGLQFSEVTAWGQSVLGCGSVRRDVVFLPLNITHAHADHFEMLFFKLSLFVICICFEIAEGKSTIKSRENHILLCVTVTQTYSTHTHRIPQSAAQTHLGSIWSSHSSTTVS